MKERITFPPHVQQQLRDQYEQKPELQITSQECENVNEQIVGHMQRTFDNKDPGTYLTSLETMEQKEKTLRIFSEKLFKIYGLKDVTVQMDYLDSGTAGYYSFDKRKLVVNMSYLSFDNPILERDAVDTILHETRHAVQHAAMHGNNPLGFDDATIIEWIKNKKNYIRASNDPVGYRTQALEADAWSTARYNMYSYLQSIK